MNSLYLIISSFLIFYVGPLSYSSCSWKNSNDKRNIAFLASDTIPIRIKIKELLKPDNLTQLNLNEDQKNWLLDYYTKRDFEPLWVSEKVYNEKGKELKKTLDQSICFGVPKNRLEISNISDPFLAEDELMLTSKAAILLNDLNNGFISTVEKSYKPRRFISQTEFEKEMNSPNNDSFDEIFLSQQSNNLNYQILLDKVHDYCLKYPLDDHTFNVVSAHTDSKSATSEAKKSLVSKGYLKNPDNSTEYTTALKLFQKHNGLDQDAFIGENTAEALNESTKSKIYRAAIALDRIRHHKYFPQKYIHINIPEYKLRFFINKNLELEHKIIVGTELNQTPELTSKIHSIVVYPYWNVPYSIASKEMLPLLKKDRFYLVKNKYKLYSGEKEIGSTGVRWSNITENNFPYNIVQSPGAHNSLGIVKFEFHNNHSVYIHDTPSKSLFFKDVRSFSHGCMRLENPTVLAKKILDTDVNKNNKNLNQFNGNSFETLLKKGENYTIKLEDQIPLYIEYLSAGIQNGNLVFFLDIYHKDYQYFNMMD